MISVDKSNIPLDQYENSLPKTHLIFLQSNDHRGFSSKIGITNPSRTRNDIMKNMGKSLKLIHNTLRYSKNLKTKEIYDIFNAQNLQFILESLMRVEKYNEFQYQYDFRTSEIARLMLEISLEYLKHSPIFKDVQSIKEVSNSLSRDARTLSYSLLMKEEPDVKVIESNKEKSFKVFNEISGFIGMLNEEYPLNVDTAIKLNKEKLADIVTEISRIKILIDTSKQNKKLSKSLDKQYVELMDEFEKINNDYLILKQIKLRDNEMNELDSEPYAHLTKYFSNINPLKIQNMWERVLPEST